MIIVSKVRRTIEIESVTNKGLQVYPLIHTEDFSADFI